MGVVNVQKQEENDKQNLDLSGGGPRMKTLGKRGDQEKKPNKTQGSEKPQSGKNRI